MQEAVTWAALIGAASAIGAVITFWMNRGKAEAETKSKAESAYTVASAAMAKTDMLTAQLAEARVEFARDYASHKDLAAAEVRFAAAIDGLREEFRGMNQRLDRIIDNFTEHRPKSGR